MKLLEKQKFRQKLEKQAEKLLKQQASQPHQSDLVENLLENKQTKLWQSEFPSGQ